MSGTWGCPHEVNDTCSRVNKLPCDPGMKGCVLAGRYIFFGNEEKNERLRSKRAHDPSGADDPTLGDIAGDNTEP